MARLARYADSLRRAPGAPIDEASRRSIPGLPPKSALNGLSPRPGPPPVETIVWGGGNSDLIPAAAPARPHPTSIDWRPRNIDIRLTLFGQLLAAFTCALAVIAFERFDTMVASVVVLALVAVGVLASVRRLPLAFWWTLGLVVGGVLGRFS